jgi:V/A-type H+-transporting ATPase subunit B
MGVEGLPENDRKFLEFGDAFEERFVAQDGPRTLEESMALGWELLRGLPPGELTRLSSAQLAKYIETEEAAAKSTEHGADTEEELAVAAGEEGSGY